MISIYIFCLVLGGAFLLVSLVGDVFEADADVEVDADFDVDGDFDVDAGDAADAADTAHATHAAKIFSIRGLIYAMFGFGAVGSLLTWTSEAGFLWTLGAALLGGLLTGGLVTLVFNWLKATDMDARGSDRGFVGLSGTVTLPLSEGSAGTVMVERGHRRIALRALPHPSATGDVRSWRSVMVIEMENGVARVAPVEEDLALGP